MGIPDSIFSGNMLNLRFPRRRFVQLLAVVAATSCPGIALAQQNPSAIVYDLVLRNARIVDGTGSPWYQADLAIHSLARARSAGMTTAGNLHNASERSRLSSLSLASSFAAGECPQPVAYAALARNVM